MKTDADIKRDVEAELQWTPDVDQTDIAVKITGGAVTLTGYVPNDFQKSRAEAAVKRIVGVRAVANDIVVRLPADDTATDPEIAREAVSALKHALPLAADNVRVLVHQGHLALEGTLEWHYQREAAESTVRRIRGVLGVRNSIALKPGVAASDIRQKIEQAFRRNAAVDAQRITVETRGAEVTLRGEVRSWAERDEAQQTAWAAPGVAAVKNEITVRT